MDSRRQRLLDELLMERFGPPPLPEPAPPHPVEQAIADRGRVPAAAPRRRGHLVVHEGGADPGVAA